MKRYIFLILAIVPASLAFAQSVTPTPTVDPWDNVHVDAKPYPRSVIDIGAGLGANYGFLGGQVVLGYKGSGLLLGLGGAPGGLLAYAVGGQFSYDWIFVSMSYAITGSYKNGSDPAEPVMGLVGIAGAKVNLLRSKKLFLQLGLGYQASTIKTSLGSVDNSGFTFSLGLGYRIAFKKEKGQI